MAKTSLVIVAVVIASWSLLVLYQEAFDHSFGATFTSLLEAYDEWTQLIVMIIGPLAKFCVEGINYLFGWQLELHPYWKHILIILCLYMTNYISNNAAARPRNAIALSLVIAPLAILGAVGFGAMLSQGVAASLAFPIGALIMFAIAASVSTSVFYPPEGQAVWETFRYYWSRTVMPFVVIGVTILAGGFVSDFVFVQAAADSFALALLATFVLGLATNLLIRGTAGPMPDGIIERVKHRFSGFGARLGTRIVSVYALATGQFLLDLGVLKPMGA